MGFESAEFFAGISEVFMGHVIELDNFSAFRVNHTYRYTGMIKKRLKLFFICTSLAFIDSSSRTLFFNSSYVGFFSSPELLQFL